MLYLRKLKREKRARRRLEEELTEKLKRLSQYEPNAKEILRAAGKVVVLIFKIIVCLVVK